MWHDMVILKAAVELTVLSSVVSYHNSNQFYVIQNTAIDQFATRFRKKKVDKNQNIKSTEIIIIHYNTKDSNWELAFHNALCN
jgi:hypothetical protein